MIRLIAFAAFALALATSAAEAMPRVPLHQPDGMTTQVYYGYGYRRYGYGYGYRPYGYYGGGYRHYGYSPYAYGPARRHARRVYRRNWY